MSNGSDDPRGYTGLRPRRNRPGVQTSGGTGAVGIVAGTHTPPCLGCRCPLRNDDRECPRCHRATPWAAQVEA